VGARTAIALARLGAPPEVKAAAAAQMPEWTNLPPVCYADEGRSYPVHTPLAALVSAACYVVSGAADTVAEARIKRACARHGLPGVWAEFAKRAAEAAGPAEPGRYALPDQKRYPIDTPERVKRAAAYLAEYGPAFSDAERRTFAENLLAADAGVLAPVERGAVEHAAGLGRPAVPLAQVFSPRKAAAAGRPELLRCLERLETAVAGGGCVYKAAAVLERVDRAMGWRFRAPGPLLTGLTPTAAKTAAAEFVRAPSGDWYRAADLTAVPASALVAGYATPPVVSKEARVRLLEKYGAAFQDFLAGFGVNPVRPAAAGRPRADWDALAQ
jgi:hypothetical protein